MPFYRIKPDRDRPPGWLIFELGDIPFYVEPSFLILVLIFAMPEAQSSGSLVRGALYGLIIFVSLIVHEAGHAVVARLFGLEPITVGLYAFGGRTSHPVTTHPRSLAIIAAGPAMTLALFVVALAVPLVFPASMQLEAARYVIARAALVNLFWFVFNILPVYPMDGGQLVFHLLSFLWREPRALLTVACVSVVTCGGAAYWLYTRNSLGMFNGLIVLMFVMQNVDIIRKLHRL